MLKVTLMLLFVVFAMIELSLVEGAEITGPWHQVKKLFKFFNILLLSPTYTNLKYKIIFKKFMFVFRSLFYDDNVQNILVYKQKKIYYFNFNFRLI